jgi:hypothetical protein
MSDTHQTSKVPLPKPALEMQHQLGPLSALHDNKTSHSAIYTTPDRARFASHIQHAQGSMLDRRRRVPGEAKASQDHKGPLYPFRAPTQPPQSPTSEDTMRTDPVNPSESWMRLRRYIDAQRQGTSLPDARRAQPARPARPLTPDPLLNTAEPTTGDPGVTQDTATQDNPHGARERRKARKIACLGSKQIRAFIHCKCKLPPYAWMSRCSTKWK